LNNEESYMTDRRQKAIDRATKLRASMQSERELGNDAAAQAFASAMSRMLLEHELLNSDLDQHEHEGAMKVEEPIIERQVSFESMGVKTVARSNASLTHLAQVVGQAHLAKILVSRRSNALWFVGTALACETSEFMLSTLWRSLGKLARSSYKQAAPAQRALQMAVGTRPESSQVYTQSFKQAFICHLAIRYKEELDATVTRFDTVHAEAAEAEANTAPQQTGLMVVNNAIARVQSYVDSKYGKPRRGRGGRGSSSYSSLGSAAGRAAANGVNLRANGLGSGRKGIGA
jgi:hypothetical protein